MSLQDIAVSVSFPTFLAGGGEMGGLMRAHDWSSSSFGSPESWPQSLRSVVGLMLANRHLMFVAWGPELDLLYNDGYAPVLGAKHPSALGRPLREVWPEIWTDIAPLVDIALGGEATWSENLPLIMERNGFPEEAWFTFSYSPVRDESGEIAGLFCAGTETTQRVLADRRAAAEGERQRRMLRQMPGFVGMLSGPDLVYDYVNDAYATISERTDFVGRRFRDVFADIEGQGFFEAFEGAYRTGQGVVTRGMEIRLHGRGDTQYVDFVLEPIRDEAGAVAGLFVGGYETTELYRGNAALRAHQAALKEAQRMGRIGSWELDASTGVTTGSDELFRIFGLDPNTQTIPDFKDQCGTFYPPESWARIDAALARALETGVGYELDLPAYRAGEPIWITVRSEVVHDAAGAIVGLRGTVQDISERKAGEAALHASEARYRALFEAVDAGFCVADIKFDGAGRAVDCCFVETNPAFELQTGLFDAAGKCASEVAPGLEKYWFDMYGRVALTGEAERFENRAETLGRWYDVQAFRTGAPEQRRIALLFNDITERKEAESRLRDLNETLEARVAERTAERDEVWRNSHDLMLVANFDATMLAVNPAWTNVLGWSESELIGRSFLDLIHPDDLASSQAEAARLSAEGRVTMQFENRYCSKDGRWYWLSWAVSSHGGRFYAVARDVTLDKAREAELAAAQDALRQSQKMEAMGQLTGGVAHDFNNLLTPIVGSLDLLQRKGLGDERERRLIDGALQSAERAKLLVQRLLAFARRQPLQSQAVDVTALVEGMGELIASTSGPRVRVEIDSAADLPHASADPNQLEMALLNLAVNARDAMPDGGTLTISAQPEAIAVGHRSRLDPGRYVRLSVADSGAGMDEATLARAVEPFFSTKGVGKGTGLGLSMVHGLAAQLGGALAIQSKPGLGTCVELWLPVTDEVAFASERPAGVDARAAAGTVLLVDDEELVRVSTADMLTDLGYAVVEAGSAEEALRLVDGGAQFDMLITDHLMPGMTGTQLARELQARRAGTPVLIVSGYAEVEGIAPDLPRLSKPFRQADLAESVAALTKAAQ